MKPYALRVLALSAALLCLSLVTFAQSPSAASTDDHAKASATSSSFSGISALPLGWRIALEQNLNSCRTLGTCVPVRAFRFQRLTFPGIGGVASSIARGRRQIKSALFAPRPINGPIPGSRLAGQSLFFGQAQAAPLTPTSAIWNGGAGNWSNASMWSTGIVPNGNDNVFIDNGNSVASPVTLDTSVGIQNLTIDSDDSLSFNLNTQLTVNGGTIANSGKMVINGGSGSNTLLVLGANTSLQGGGTVTLSVVSGGGSALIQGNGFTLTNTNNTIQGDGAIGNGSLAFANESTVDANVSGQALLLNGSGGITNTGLLEATNGGILALDGVNVNNSGGNITANGGTVQLINGTDIQGGTLNSLNGGTLGTPGANNATLDGSTANGAVTLSTGSTYTTGLNAQTTLLGTINNKGNFLVNGGNGNNTLLLLGANTTLQSGGTVTLSTASGGGNAIIQGNGFTLTNTNNTIQGEGVIGNGSLTLINQSSGVINANSTGGSLTSSLVLNGSGGITNTGLLEATNSGVLALNSVNVNNSGGNITANGGTVQLFGSTNIQGGTLNSLNGGTLGTPNSSSATLDGSTANGAVTLSTGSTYTTGLGAQTTLLGTINNKGTFLVNGGAGNNTLLLLGASTSLQGGGTVTLSTASGGGNAIIQGNGFTLTNTNNTIQGNGVIGNGSLAFANGSTVDANVSGQALLLNGSGGITNTGLLEATNSGVLALNSVNVNNSGGNITANGGTVQLFGSTDIQGGTLNGGAGGTLGTPGGNSATLDGKAHGALTLSTGSTYTTGLNAQTTLLGTINNKGTFLVNGGNGTNTLLLLGANTTLQSGGTITLSTIAASGGNAIIQGNSLTLTNTDNIIQGEGVIGNGSLTLINQSSGVINANSTGGSLTSSLVLNGSGGITNTGLLEATNSGVLALNSVNVNNSGGNITANGGTVQLFGSTNIQGGTLNSLNGGTLGTPGGNSATLDGSTANGAVTLSTGSTYTTGLGAQTTLLGTMNNKGTFLVNGGNGNNTLLLLGANTSLQGGGTVTLSTASGGGNAIIQGNGFTLTNTNNTIQGSGAIGNGNLAFANASTVDANVSGQALLLNGSGGITNTGLLEATNSGVLALNGVNVNNSGGKITANGGTVQLFGSTDIQGGTLNSLNGGTLGTPGGNNATLDGKAHGALTLSTGSTYTTGLNAQTTLLGTINNNGTFLVNGGAGNNTLLLLGANTTLQGSGKGRVTLSTASGGGNAIIQGNGLTLTNTNNTIQGNGVIGNGSLTLVNSTAGTIFANVSGQTLFVNGSGKITNKGTFEVASGATMHVSNGPFTNFAGTTLTGGTYNISGTLQIDELGSTGGEIVTNASKIILNGPSSSFIDSAGLNALTNFTTNAAAGAFTLSGGQNFTTNISDAAAGNFTNSGSLTVNAGSTFDVTGSLTNFSGTTLTGGTYTVGGTFEFPGANIVTNAANLTLTGASYKILNSTNNANALANFATNASTGTFGLLGGATFATAGNFTNAGILSIGAGTKFTVGGPGVFTQTTGKTTADGTLTDSGGFTLTSGLLFGKGSINGAVASNGTVTPGDSTTIVGILKDNGAYTQNSTGVLDISIGGTTSSKFDQLNVTTASLNGTLNITLIKNFIPPLASTFKIVNFSSGTGMFSTVNGLPINASEHFAITYQTNDVLLTVASGASIGRRSPVALPLALSRRFGSFSPSFDAPPSSAVAPRGSSMPPQSPLSRVAARLGRRSIGGGFSLPLSLSHLFSKPRLTFAVN